MKLLPLLALTALSFFSTLAPAQEPSAPTPEGPTVNYTFNAKVYRVLAGDLVALDVDLGFGVWMHNQTFKLQEVTAPAMDGPDKESALKAKSATQKVLVVGAELILQSIKDKTDKTKTYHGILWLNGENLNKEVAKSIAEK